MRSGTHVGLLRAWVYRCANRSRTRQLTAGRRSRRPRPPSRSRTACSRSSGPPGTPRSAACSRGRARPGRSSAAARRVIASAAAVTEDEAGARLRSAVMARRAERQVARWDWPWRPTPAPNPSDGGTPDASTGEADAATAPDNPSVEQDPGKPIGVCGPDVTKQVKATLTEDRAGLRGLVEGRQEAGVRPDLQPASTWRRRRRGARPRPTSTAGTPTACSPGSPAGCAARPCARRAPPRRRPHRQGPSGSTRATRTRRTCSNTVQIGNGCWLAGTVNYATFGIMVRLCGSAFSGDPEVGGEEGARAHAETLIKGYKTPLQPGGPEVAARLDGGGRPGRAGRDHRGRQRQPRGCSTTCGQRNPKVDPSKLVSWDYVWEPVRPRVPNPTPAAAAPPPRRPDQRAS